MHVLVFMVLWSTFTITRKHIFNLFMCLTVSLPENLSSTKAVIFVCFLFPYSLVLGTMGSKVLINNCWIYEMFSTFPDRDNVYCHTLIKYLVSMLLFFFKFFHGYLYFWGSSAIPGLLTPFTFWFLNLIIWSHLQFCQNIQRITRNFPQPDLVITYFLVKYMNIRIIYE